MASVAGPKICQFVATQRLLVAHQTSLRCRPQNMSVRRVGNVLPTKCVAGPKICQFVATQRLFVAHQWRSNA